MAIIILEIDTDLREDVEALVDVVTGTANLLSHSSLVRYSFNADSDLVHGALDNRLDDVIDYVNVLSAKNGGVKFIPEPRELSPEYGIHQWTGNPYAVVESETYPWVADPEGHPVDFSGADDNGVPRITRVVRGVYAQGTQIMRDDIEQRYRSDLCAARRLAKNLTKAHGREYTVWYSGTP